MSKKHTRPYTHTKKKLGDSWRRPKGLHSKRRLQHKGHSGLVKIGQRGKASERHKYQKKQVVTTKTVTDLKQLDKEKQAARIPRMGRKKKTPLVQYAEENNITIVNLDAQKYLEQTKQLLNQKEQSKQEKTSKKNKQEEEEKEETTEEETTQDKPSEEENETTIPTKENTIPEIKEWLDQNNIEYTSSLRKAELLELVEENKE